MTILIVAATIFPLSACSRAFAQEQLDRNQEEFGGGVIAISAGLSHSAAITADGGLWAWGANNHGQIGDNGSRDSLRRRPVRVFEDVAAVSIGVIHTSMINTNNELWVWGGIGFDPYGIGTVTQSGVIRIPVFVTEDVIATSSGFSYTMFIDSENTLWGWGANRSEQLGYGRSRLSPIVIMEDVAAVSASRSHVMAITSDGTLWGWGSNQYGQLGDGTVTNSINPIVIMHDATYVPGGDAGLESGFTADIDYGNTLWTWEQLMKLMSHTDISPPEPVRVMESVAYVSAGDAGLEKGFTAAIDYDNTLWTWGSNHRGQLGDGTNINRLEPIKVMENVVYVSAGGGHIMAITSDGSLWAWGDNHYGQLGDGTNIERRIPIQIMENVVAVSAGQVHTMAITANGELWIWGNNRHGQLGDGTTTNRSSPMRIK